MSALTSDGKERPLRCHQQLLFAGSELQQSSRGVFLSPWCNKHCGLSLQTLGYYCTAESSKKNLPGLKEGNDEFGLRAGAGAAAGWVFCPSGAVEELQILIFGDKK